MRNPDGGHGRKAAGVVASGAVGGDGRKADSTAAAPGHRLQIERPWGKANGTADV